MVLSKVSFYIMNDKGLFVLTNFIKKHGTNDIAFVVSERDLNVKDDCYDCIKNISLANNLVFYNRKEIYDGSYASLRLEPRWRRSTNLWRLSRWSKVVGQNSGHTN